MCYIENALMHDPVLYASWPTPSLLSAGTDPGDNTVPVHNNIAYNAALNAFKCQCSFLLF